MRTFPLIWAGFSLFALTFNLPSAQAETAAAVATKTKAAIDSGAAPKWWSPELPEQVRRDVDGKGKRLAEKLALNDEAKTQKVAALIAEHFARVWAWHQQIDEKLDAAWSAWDAARDTSKGQPKDELKALTVVTEQVDPISAEFTPQIHSLLSALGKEIGEEKTTALVDTITRSPGAKRTFDAYVAMVPEMTDAEKAVLWDRLVAAREESLSAWSDKQIIKIFKKYKVRNEFSIDYFGYGYQKRYQEWIAKSKAAKP